MNITKRLQAEKELSDMLEISIKKAEDTLDKMILEVNINNEQHSRLSI